MAKVLARRAAICGAEELQRQLDRPTGEEGRVKVLINYVKLIGG